MKEDVVQPPFTPPHLPVPPRPAWLCRALPPASETHLLARLFRPLLSACCPHCHAAHPLGHACPCDVELLSTAPCGQPPTLSLPPRSLRSAASIPPARSWVPATFPWTRPLLADSVNRAFWPRDRAEAPGDLTLLRGSLSSRPAPQIPLPPPLSVQPQEAAGRRLTTAASTPSLSVTESLPNAPRW